MRHSILLLILTFSISSAWSQGMVFETSEWSDILAKAEKEQKLIYLDAYASWCGPCKMMKKSVFTDEQVGDYFNKNFINAAIDMEKGEGPELAKKFAVQAYPTHLVINGKGELVHRGLGYMDAEDFITFGKNAQNPEVQLIGLQRKYKDGNREEEFLRKYINVLAESNDPAGEEVAADYLKTQKDLTSPANLNILYMYGMRPTSPNHKYILENKKALTEKYQTGFLSGLAFAYFGESVRSKKSLDVATKEIVSAYPEEKDILTFYMKSNDASMKRDNERYIAELTSFLKGKNIKRFSYDELNSFAWFIFENDDKKSDINQAIEWAQVSVDKHPGYANYDTLAQLLFKGGKSKEAKVAAEKAIELGKAKGEDTSSTEELLQKI